MKFIYIALLILASQSFAQSNPPELAGPTQLGRVVLYKSWIGYSYFTPTAFSSQFRCLGGGAQRVCQLNVYNALTEDEKAEIRQLSAADGLKIVTFSNVNSSIVSNITESFDNLPNLPNPQFLEMKTLEMSSGNVPYASVAFRTDSNSADALQSQYQAGGLGTYTVEFNLHAQQTNALLELSKPGCVQETFSPAAGKGLWWKDAAKLIDTAIQNCGMKSFGFRDDEALHEMRLSLAKTFFEHVFFKGYFVKEDALQSVQEAGYVVYDIAVPAELSCRVDLVLKQDARPQYHCIPAGGSQ